MTTEMTVGKYPAQLLLDILTDGVEGGMGSWSQIEEYKWMWWYMPDETGKDVVYPHIVNEEKVNADTTLLRIRDMHWEDDEGPGEFVDITLNKLAEATDWARENYSHLLAPWTVGKGGIIDDINYDAVGADVIIQKIVIGEVIYG